MQVNPDPILQAAAVQALRDEYGMDQRRPGVHQSALSYCLTKAFFDETDPEPPSEKEVVLFSIGFGLERVIFDRGHETPLVIDDIHLSLDDILKFGGGVDLKSTRMAAKGRKGTDGFEFPDGWKRQFAAYVYGLNRLARERGEPETFTFGAIVIHLVTAEVTAWRIVFEPHELEENWSWYQTRYDQHLSMRAANDPQPFMWNEEWECGIGTSHPCRYLTRCSLTASIKELEGA